MSGLVGTQPLSLEPIPALLDLREDEPIKEVSSGNLVGLSLSLTFGRVSLFLVLLSSLLNRNWNSALPKQERDNSLLEPREDEPPIEGTSMGGTDGGNGKEEGC